MSLCNAENKGSRFALSEREQTSSAYQLHEGIGNCECIRFNYTIVRTIQTWNLTGTRLTGKKQKNTLLALKPVAETTADRVSFGFRRYRSPEDARKYAFSVLSRKDSPQWDTGR